MAGAFIRDEFEGEGDTPLWNRATETGELWGSWSTGPPGTGFSYYEDSYDVPHRWRVKNGKAFFTQPNWVSYADDKYAFAASPRFLMLYPGSEFTGDLQRRWRWTLPRFPDVDWEIPTNYIPPAALLCFDSEGIAGVYQHPSLVAVRVELHQDHSGARVRVTSPQKTSTSTGLFIDPVTYYTPLPDLDDPEHPDEYRFKVVSTNSTASLYLNDVAIYENAPHSIAGYRGGIGVQVGRNSMPGTLTGFTSPAPPGMPWAYRMPNFENIIEFSEFSLNYRPPLVEDDSKLRVYNRHDGRNASTAPYVYRGGGGDIWCYGGYN